MTVTVNRSDLTQIPERNRLVTEASSVGLAPGVWPSTVIVLGTTGGTFDRYADVHHGDELHGVDYHSRCGQWTLVLLND